ncbi:MAG: zinc ABC transporter substrate-binding protein [Planctomycetota bacterium]
MRSINNRHYLSFLLLAVTISGCGQSQSHSHGDATDHVRDGLEGKFPIEVLCTTGTVAELAERVGGEHVEVTVLMNHDVDPHLYKPVFADIERLDQADLIFYSGLHLEGRMADLFVQRARTKPTYAVTEGLVSRNDKRLREPPEFEGMHDPHVWHDVSIWADCAHDVADIMSKLDPEHAADYDKNAHAYMDELAELHQYCQEQIASIPTQSRMLVTAHDAFGYFGQAYGLEVFGLKGISSEEEKDLQHQEEVQQMIIERKIPAVFVESTIAHRTVEALIEPCRAAGWNLRNGGELYADALGAADSDASTYTGMIRHNVNTIVEGLTSAVE